MTLSTPEALPLAERAGPAPPAGLGGALLYLPDAAALRLAARPVGGRTLTVRSLVAALSTGASVIAVPSILRSAAVERALTRMPALATAVRWLEPGSRPPAGPPDQPWLLVPATSLVQASVLQELITPAAPPEGAVLAASATGPAPVAVLPRAAVGALWSRLAAGTPVGASLVRLLQDGEAQVRESTSLYVTVSDETARARAEKALLDALGIEADTGIDRYFHRRCSRWITRVLMDTPATPNQISMASLTIGSAAIWCFWRATPLSALWGVILYAVASIVDHADGEIARLTFQESRVGAHLDWAIDTLIHSGLVLGMAVTAGGQLMPLVGLLGALGITLSALFARYLPPE
ncbi:MAG TPA: CDP-alcohol phosphatidyltransferase family protein, partial [Patescibacteria group bacterium]|nr:CDP-alcohol phosphatidyltransferase family protein [Patescibacteria group bacterium]